MDEGGARRVRCSTETIGTPYNGWPPVWIPVCLAMYAVYTLTQGSMETYMMRRTDFAAFLTGGEILYNHRPYTAAKDLDIWSPLVHHSTRCHALSELRRGLSD